VRSSLSYAGPLPVGAVDGVGLVGNKPVLGSVGAEVPAVWTSVWRELWRYGIAVSAVVLAGGARLMLGGLVEDGVPFITFFPAVAVAAMVGGGRSGLAATLLSTLVVDWFFIKPVASLKIQDSPDVVSLLLFVAAGLVMSGTSAMLSRTREKQRRAAEEVRGDLEAMERLQKIGALFVSGDNFEFVLGEIVEAAMSISGADFGNIQIVAAGSSELRIVAQRGFPQWWVDYWNGVGEKQGSCGTALEKGERVIVEDVERSLIFAGTAGLEMQRRAGVLAVQSTPLLSRSGKLLGVFSTHYRRPHCPESRALRLLDLLGRQAADIIEQAQKQEALRQSELREKAKAVELATLLDSAPMPIFIVHNAAGAHITGNRAADEFLQNQHGAEASLSAPEGSRPQHFRAVKDGRELSTEELPAQRAARGEVVRDF